MPKVVLTPAQPPSPAVAGTMLDVSAAAMTAGVTGAGNEFRFHNMGGLVRALFTNTGAGARTIQPKRKRTSGGILPTDDTISIPAGKTIAWRFDSDYQDVDGYVDVAPEHAEVKAAVIY